MQGSPPPGLLKPTSSQPVLNSVPTQPEESDPDFTGPIQNITAAVGRLAVLSCTVTDLGPYKVRF